LFLAGIIPGHIHGFYIICTYFHRKRKVKKGRYPGGRKMGIFSERVWNGDASNAKVRDLLLKERGEVAFDHGGEVGRSKSYVGEHHGHRE